MSLIALVTLFGCAETPSKPNPTPPAPPAAAPAAPAPAAPAAKPAKVQAENPSPLKLDREVKDAGLAQGVAALVPATMPATTGSGKDGVAFRTGVVLAYTVLGGEKVPKPQFLAQLKAVRAGLTELGAGKGLVANLDGFITNVENDTASRTDFIQELDEVAGHADPEGGWGPDDTTGPALQAGAWLATTRLVAQAVVDGKRPETGVLLHRPGVAEYFLEYVRNAGRPKVGALGPELERCLETLSAVGQKPAPTLEDAAAVLKATDGVMALL